MTDSVVMVTTDCYGACAIDGTRVLIRYIWNVDSICKYITWFCLAKVGLDGTVCANVDFVVLQIDKSAVDVL